MEAISWLNSSTREALIKGPDRERLLECEKALEKVKAWTLAKGEGEYPHLLAEIYNPPVLLFGIGEKRVLNGPNVAIVGSRRATRYGQEAAQKIARGLAQSGVTVVSGMAMGIDTFAHRGAIEAGGKTVAVLGSGIDVPYPLRNRRLMQDIVKNGAVITEFLPGTPPEPKNFPQRNRIISGISLGVVVVEAGLRSGSLITASLALEQGREVMAVPGSVRSNVSRGTHWLIKQGATLVETAEDVLEALGLDKHSVENKSEIKVHLDDIQKQRVLDCIGPYPIHIDEICQKTGIGPGPLGSILLELELDGFVVALPGKYFQIGEKLNP
ncbi:Rossmann fold nucleotide-binding protein Smf [Dissulfuribacter thermophilus]|uniref:Rossmann fold nucleotide-binding protein Smf n=1 Tax=Dissulfuribacter thermophilus TaxID=1156395 RepID=A0A1B9F732_9BACT|nr:Rossmann fold nucleotide-binding protein Smf [Dissulfuribacter thermophilus]